MRLPSWKWEFVLTAKSDCLRNSWRWPAVIAGKHLCSFLSKMVKLIIWFNSVLPSQTNKNTMRPKVQKSKKWFEVTMYQIRRGSLFILKTSLSVKWIFSWLLICKTFSKQFLYSVQRRLCNRWWSLWGNPIFILFVWSWGVNWRPYSS